MSTFALTANGALAGRAGATVPLRSPLPVWIALFANVLAFSELPTLIPIPTTVGRLITQGALVLAFLLALRANPRCVIRPNLFLILLTMLAVVALVVSIHNEFLLGSTFRACRLLGFVAVLWLLTPWWGRSDLVLLRSQITCLRIVLGTVLVGAVLAPGVAFSYDGRLTGALWPIPPTQVAHYAAVLARMHRRVVVRWSRTRSNRLTDASRRRSSLDRRANSDRTHCDGDRLGRRWREHVPGPRTSSARIGPPRRDRRHRGGPFRTFDQQLVLAGGDAGRGGAAHRTHQGVD